MGIWDLILCDDIRVLVLKLFEYMLLCVLFLFVSFDFIFHAPHLHPLSVAQANLHLSLSARGTRPSLRARAPPRPPTPQRTQTESPQHDPIVAALPARGSLDPGLL